MSERTSAPVVPFAPAAPMVDRAVALCIAVICIAECVALHGLRHDDAYITFRYAENLARGLGPVFNPGERVLGTTAPGHMLLGALLYTIVGKAALPTAMSIVGCLGWGAQALAVFALMRSAFARTPSACASFAVALGASSPEGLVALETNLVAACVLWSVVFAMRHAWLPAAITCACAGFLRADSFLLTLVIGTWGLCVARRQLLLPIAAFAAITLPWQIFAWLFYGSPLPQTVAAKQGRTSFVTYVTHELRESIAPPFHGSLTVWLCVIGWIVAILGAVILVKRQRNAWILPAYAAMHFAAYAYLRPVTEHYWHLYPLRIVLVVFAAAAVAHFYERSASKGTRVGYAVLVTLLLASYGSRVAALARTHETEYWLGARDAAYAEVAKFLLRHARPDDVIGAIEVGTLGYKTELRMYDWGGLITIDPQPMPRDGRLAWMVIDDAYGDRVDGAVPARHWDVHGFKVGAYSLDWMGRAMRAAMARFPGMPPGQILTAHRDIIVQELHAIVHAEELAHERF